MAFKSELLARFANQADDTLLYVPDLTAWYNWHTQKATLPDAWQGLSLPQIAHELNVPAWQVIRPWRIETPGVDIATTEEDTSRETRIETASGTLTARWTLGSDGNWWQMEYPVKTADDLSAALEWARTRMYVLDAEELARCEEAMGDQGVVAVEIPTRPYADLLHDLLGLSEGPILLSEGHPAVGELMTVLEEKLQAFIPELAHLPGSLMFSPDNLDAQFISPMVFQEHLADSYRHTAEVLHANNKSLLVHAGGPIRRLLAPLAEAGADGIQGIAGPPQSDASPNQAREIAGPGITLWGGIPQNQLLEAHDRQEFEATVTQVAREARGDRRLILGVADRVPVGANLNRLEAIPALIAQV